MIQKSTSLKYETSLEPLLSTEKQLHRDPARSSYHTGANLSLPSEGASGAILTRNSPKSNANINDGSREDRDLQKEGVLNNRTLLTKTPQPSQSRAWLTPRINTGGSQPAEGV